MRGMTGMATGLAVAGCLAIADGETGRSPVSLAASASPSAGAAGPFDAASPSPAATSSQEPVASGVVLPIGGIKLKEGEFVADPGGPGPEGPELRAWRTTVSTLAGAGEAGYGDGDAAGARFNLPASLVVASDGTLFVSEVGGLRIRRIDPAGRVATLAGDGTPGRLDGAGASARFEHPLGLSLASGGNLLVADASASAIRAVAPDGRVSTFAGKGSDGYANGAADAAMFSYPTGVLATAAGVFVADFSNSRIRSIGLDSIVASHAGIGIPGYQDATRSLAAFNGPVDLAAGADGRLYVSDLLNHVVRVVERSGQVRTLAGQGSAGFADGSGSQARFNLPVGLTVDAAGNVFVADWGNHRIRRIDPSGFVTTLAGGAVPGYADGDGEEARFNGPRGLAFWRSGELAVADQLGHRIRRVRIDSR